MGWAEESNVQETKKTMMIIALTFESISKTEVTHITISVVYILFLSPIRDTQGSQKRVTWHDEWGTTHEEVTQEDTT